MLFIVIGNVYTNLTNLDCVLLAVVKCAPYIYKSRFNISKLCCKATLFFNKVKLYFKINYVFSPPVSYLRFYF